MHVKVKDNVLVIAGKDRGRRGAILSVNTTDGRVIVERVNMIKKHARANPKKGVQGGIIEQEAPIQASNLMLVCTSCNEPTRARSEKGARTCRRCNAAIK